LKVRRPRPTELLAMVALVAILSLLAYPFIRLWPSKPVVKHVDPASEAEGLPLPTLLMALIANVFDSLIGGDYKAIAEGLKTLGEAYIPKEYRFVFERFVQLLDGVSTLLSDVEDLLDRAEALLAVGRGEDAKPLLDEASAKLASANTTHVELKSACAELAKNLKLPMDELSRKVDELGRVIERLYERLLRLLEEIERQVPLEDTYLAIDVEPRTVWTGSSIDVSGKLYTAKAPLAKRSVQIFIKGVALTEAVTDDSGEFRARVVLHYIYEPKVFVQAVYVPSGLDAELYKPSTSNIVEVDIIYIKPIIRVEVLGEALPGKAFVVRGSVEAERPLPYSTVKISWIRASVKATLEDGRFTAMLHTPEDVSEGEYALKVEAPARQVFGPAEASVKVTVRRLPLNVTIHVPPIVVAGLPSSLRGEIHSLEELNATVKVVFADQTYTARSSGTLELSLTAPLTVLSGYRDYEVHVSPTLPWYRSATLKGTVLVINPLTVLAPLALISALALRISREKTVRARPEEVPPRPEAPLAAPVTAPELERPLDMYWQAVAMVSSLTGVEMSPSMTIREYLNAVGPRLGGLRSAFEVLSIVAEKALYAPSVSAEELEAAEKALEELKVAHVGARL